MNAHFFSHGLVAAALATCGVVCATACQYDDDGPVAADPHALQSLPTRYLTIETVRAEPDGGAVATGIAIAAAEFIPDRYRVVGLTYDGELTLGRDARKEYATLFLIDERVGNLTVPLSNLDDWVRCDDDCSYVMSWNAGMHLVDADFERWIFEPIFCRKLAISVGPPDPRCTQQETCGNGCCRDDEDVLSCSADCDLAYTCEDYCTDQANPPCGYVGPGLVWPDMQACIDDCRHRNCKTCLDCIGKYTGPVARCNADCDPSLQGCMGITSNCGTSRLCGGS